MINPCHITHITINMNNKIHSHICILTVSYKCILFKHYILFVTLCHITTSPPANKVCAYGYAYLNIQIKNLKTITIINIVNI